MKCSVCKKEFFPQWDHMQVYWADEIESSRAAEAFAMQACPACGSPLVVRQEGLGAHSGDGGIKMIRVDTEGVVYPTQTEFSLPPEVPQEYQNNFLEARNALDYSAKASAALSRWLLQKVFREKLKIKKKDLSMEIDHFIESSKAPTYLSNAIDAVRQIGNFAAHPMKYTHTEAIVEVEAGEAEWLLEVLESLFDFVFVQPAKLAQRRDTLNAKLKELGKPALKGVANEA